MKTPTKEEALEAVEILSGMAWSDKKKKQKIVDEYAETIRAFITCKENDESFTCP